MSERFGRFKLVERLGVGGMAELFRAELSGPYGFAKTVAIKKILPELNRRRRFREMFLRESRIMAALHHGNLVQVNELGEVDGELFMCLEYVEGCDLAKLLRRKRLQGEVLPAWLAIWIVREVGRGLAYLHGLKGERGEDLAIVHRDVNPHNILLSVHGDVKLGDFGIAKGLTDELQTRQGQVQGKLEYLSPEQARGDVLGPASDLYSLGLVLFELLAGQRYLRGQTDFELMRAAAQPVWRSPRQTNPGISQQQEDLLRRILRPDPQERFGSAEALVAALDELWIGQAKSDPADSLAQQVEATVQPQEDEASEPPESPDDFEPTDPLRMVPAAVGRPGADGRRTGTLAVENLPADRPKSLLWVFSLVVLVGVGAVAWWILWPSANTEPTAPAPTVDPSPLDPPTPLPKADPAPKPGPDPVVDDSTGPADGTQPNSLEDTMMLVDQLLAEDEEVQPADPVSERPTTPRKKRRQRKKKRVRKVAPKPADRGALDSTVAKVAWGKAERGEWLKRWRAEAKQARARGVRTGDCPACDAHARAGVEAYRARNEPAARAALEGYSRALGELRIDNAFMDRKLKRLRAALGRKGAAKAHEEQVNRILKEIVDGRLEQANRAINRLMDEIRR